MLGIGTADYSSQKHLCVAVFCLVSGVAIGWITLLYPIIFPVTALMILLFGICSYQLIINFHIRLAIGMLVFVTMIRPWPSIGNPILVGRLIDMVWLVLAVFILFHMMKWDKIRPRMWGGIYWLVAITFSTLISTFMGIFLFDREMLWRDVFELYRGPYYVLVLLIASQVHWSEFQLENYFFRFLFIGMWVVFGVSLLQGMGGSYREMSEMMYTPKSAANILASIHGQEVVRLRNSGTFFNPNWYGVSLSILIPFLFAGCSVVRAKWLRLSGMITSILAFVFLGITGSRTGVVAGIISIGGYAYWGIRGSRTFIERIRKRKGRKFVLAYAIVICLLVYFAGPKLSRYVKTANTIATEGILADASAKGKYTGGKKYVFEALEGSPIIGFGPSKSVSSLLGDNQYSLLIYRYGLLGMICWLGFWGSIYVGALRLRKSAKSLVQYNLSRAVLASVPAFVAACLTGAFFNATQIATLFLLLIGVTYCSRAEVKEGV